MENTRIIVRMSKTARLFFKSAHYELKKDDERDFNMNHTHAIKIYDVLPGVHHLEIGSKNSSETRKITLKEGETKTLTIIPVIGNDSNHKTSLAHIQTVIFLFGLSIVCIIGMCLYFENIPIPSIFLIFFALIILLFKKSKKGNELGDFQIRIKNKAIIS